MWIGIGNVVWNLILIWNLREFVDRNVGLEIEIQHRYHRWKGCSHSFGLSV